MMEAANFDPIPKIHHTFKPTNLILKKVRKKKYPENLHAMKPFEKRK